MNAALRGRKNIRKQGFARQWPATCWHAIRPANKDAVVRVKSFSIPNRKEDELLPQKRLWRTLLRLTYLGFTFGFLMLVSRNFVSRVVAERIGSSVLATTVKIRNIHLGWAAVQISGVTVMEPRLESAAQVEVSQIDLSTSILSGFTTGKWIGEIVVSEPKLHVRFEDDGTLLSVFPTSESSSSGPTTIPIGAIVVKNAQLIVHQGDREVAVVDGATVSAKFGEMIDIRGHVGSLLSGQVAFETRVNAGTFAGVSLIHVDDCQFDCESLPGSLFPDFIRKEQIRAGLSARVKVQHPAGATDPRLHHADARLLVNDLAWSDFGTVMNRLAVAVTTNASGLAVTVNADPLGGHASFHLTSDSLEAPLQASLASEVRDCNLGPLISHFVPDIDINATGSVMTDTRVDWDGTVVGFQNTVRAVASGLRAEQLDMDAVVCDVQCSGQTPLDVTALDSFSGITGNITGNIASDGIGLRQLAERIGIADLEGRVRTAAAFEVPLDRLFDPNAVVVRATATSEGVRAMGTRLEDTVLDLVIAKGEAKANLNAANLVDSTGTRIATVSGFGEAGLATKRLNVRAGLDNLDAEQIARLGQFDEELLRGSAHADLEASAMIESLADPKAWTAVATLQTAGVVVAGEAIEDLNARCELEDGVLTVPPAIVKWRDNTCNFSLDGKLDDKLAVDANFAAGPISLGDLADVASRFSSTRLPLYGSAVLDGKLQVDSMPASVSSSGTARLTNASYASTKIGNAQLDWDGDLDGLTIHTGSDDMLGGKYSLTATANQLDWTQATVQADFSDIQASRFPRFANVSIPVTGTFEGGCKLTSLGSLDELNGNAWIRSRGLSAMKIPIELSRGEVRFQSGEADAMVAGKLLEGDFKTNARGQLRELVAFANHTPHDLRRLPITAEAKLDGLSIEKAIQAGQLQRSLRPLSGLVHASCVRNEASIRDGLICTATASTERLRWKHAKLSDRMMATVELHPDRVELTSVDGRFADGRLSGRAMVGLSAEPRGTFQFGVDRVNLRLAAAPLGSIANTASGTGSVRVAGRIGDTISGRAEISANNPSIAKLNIRAVRFPIDWAVTPSSSRVTWRCRAGTIETGNGKINVSTEGDYSRSLNMQLAAHLIRIDTSRLLQGGSVGAGILNGKVNLRAKRARRLDQIVGDFDLQMSQVDTLEMPILDQLDTLISLSPSLGIKQDNLGTIQGRLSGGMLHLDKLAISQSNIHVLMDGDASLDGRLNFDVTAATGQQGPADGLLALADSPLMLAAPAPVALVLKANEAMKDRVVHVHVGGTASRPTLRLQPGKNLTQDTLRFFLTTSFGSQIAGAVDLSQRRNQTR